MRDGEAKSQDSQTRRRRDNLHTDFTRPYHHCQVCPSNLIPAEAPWTTEMSLVHFGQAMAADLLLTDGTLTREHMPGDHFQFSYN